MLGVFGGSENSAQAELCNTKQARGGEVGYLAWPITRRSQVQVLPTQPEQQPRDPLTFYKGLKNARRLWQDGMASSQLSLANSVRGAGPGGWANAHTDGLSTLNTRGTCNE